MPVAATGANRGDYHLVRRPRADFAADPWSTSGRLASATPARAAARRSRSAAASRSGTSSTRHQVLQGDGVPLIRRPGRGQPDDHGLLRPRPRPHRRRRRRAEPRRARHHLAAPLAPFEAEVIALNPDDATVGQTAERLYGELQSAGVEVLFDDRDERAGVKFNDADLVGFPVRVVVGKKTPSRAWSSSPCGATASRPPP